jgi:hypothetical protein
MKMKKRLYMKQLNKKMKILFLSKVNMKRLMHFGTKKTLKNKN